jgi:hypothetical protein
MINHRDAKNTEIFWFAGSYRQTKTNQSAKGGQGLALTSIVELSSHHAPQEMIYT